MASHGLTDAERAMLAKPNPSVISTIRSDGQPVSAATWYLLRDDRILVNMDSGRKRLQHIRKDPRVSLTVVDEADYTATSPSSAEWSKSMTTRAWPTSTHFLSTTGDSRTRDVIGRVSVPSSRLIAYTAGVSSRTTIRRETTTVVEVVRYRDGPGRRIRLRHRGSR